jgi:1,2-diacylglycerol 3-alpha-glucosyltransferase
MKIGLFTDTFVPEVNGVASSTMMLRDELRRRGHRVFVFTTTTPEARMEPGTFRLPSMPLIVLPSRRVGLFYHPRLAGMIRSTGLDIVHTQTEFSLGIFGRMMANAIGAPQVHTYHTIYEDYTHYITRGLFDGQSKKAARGFSRLYCNSCERVLVPSEKTSALLRQYGVDRPIDIVPTGVDTAKFERGRYDPAEIAALRRELGIGERDKVVLNGGRIAKEKNLDTVLRGLPELFARHDDAKMLLVGGGPFVETLRQIAKEQNMTDRVLFAGERPWEKIGLYYALGDAFISASTSETQGLTYIEAMSAGLPVVAKEDPCIQGLIEHERTGLLFVQPEQIASALERALYDDDLRGVVERGAAAKVRENSVSMFGERVERSYEAAIEGARKITA